METTTVETTSSYLPSTGTTEGMAYTAIAGVFIAIFIVAIIGNSVVIYVLFRQRRTWNVTITYLFNLAIADAIFACTMPLWAQTYLNRMEWNFGVAACKIVAIVTSVNMYASIFFLTAMSVDRWIAVVHATTINTVRNSVMARSVCLVVWTSAILFSIPRMIYQIVKEYSRNEVSSNMTANALENVSASWQTTVEPENNPNSMFVCMFFVPVSGHKKFVMGMLELIEACVGFLIPMIVICVCYLRIVRTVRMKLISKRVRKERVAVLAALVVTAFFVCWLPKQMMFAYSAISGWWDWFPFNESFYNAVYPFFVCLAYANSCVNPIVYAFTTTNFKNNVKEVCGSNLAACKDTRAYKMTLARDDNRSPLTPNKACSSDTKKVAGTTSTNENGNGNKHKEGIHELSSSEDIYEPFHPAGRNAREAERVGINGPPECRHLAIDDTTSGVYYEYFSSPPVLQTAPEERRLNFTTRADIINHNDNDKTHHEWEPLRGIEAKSAEVRE
ncbi:type-1 angiotensin II receptor A-like [Styela clava]